MHSEPYLSPEESLNYDGHLPRIEEPKYPLADVDLAKVMADEGTDFRDDIVTFSDQRAAEYWLRRFSDRLAIGAAGLGLLVLVVAAVRWAV